jgi:precorrin-6B methylase 2
MNIFTKIIRGDEVRPTRLHTEAGTFTGLAALPGLIPAALSWVRYRTNGYYSLRPWWVWDAIRFVEQHLQHDDRVLEVGSGYSSLWLAQRCREVLSIEESLAWKERVDAEARRFGLTDVKLLNGDSRELFTRYFGNEEWEVVVIDGPRDRLSIFHDLVACASKPRLIVYDDTDKMENRAVLQTSIKGYQANVFRGFKPQTVHACETTVFIRENPI